MQIYHLSHQSLYTGLLTDYPGNIAPAGTTAVPPPNHLEGHARRFDATAQTWSHVPLAALVQPDTRTLDERKTDAKAHVTARRWEVETGGITLPDGSGTRVATTIDDQNRIASALQGMADAGIAEVDFKAESGWTRLSREELAGVAALIAGHVQACFSRERVLHEAIDAADSIEDLTAIDINAGWPGQDESGAAPDSVPVSEQAPGAA